MNDKGACSSPAGNNAVRTAPLAFADIPGQSRLFLDYQRDPASLRMFYPNAVRDISGLRTFVPEVLAGYATDRSHLCRALLEINTVFGSGPETTENIRRLGEPNTVAVVTGQQAGLFTGPLYTIYKAISAIKAAAKLTAEGIPAVPVFWIATEDHDFDEISEAFSITSSGTISRVAIERGENVEGGSVGSFVLDDSARAAVDEMVDGLSTTEFTESLGSILSQCWTSRETIGKAFGKTLARIFAPYGLILLDPTDPAIKQLAAPLYVRAIENSEVIITSLTERSRELVAAGYHEQVLIDDDYFPLFWHTDEGVRSSLRKSADGKYRSKADRREFTLSELSDRAAVEPERFSPGVMLRGVVQDYLLPTACYFGGGAEVAYFAQSGVVYRELGRPVTPVVHRQSFTIIEPRHARTLTEFGLDLTDLFDGYDTLVLKTIAGRVAPDTVRLFAEVEEKVNGELNRLDQALSNTDVSLAENLAKRRRKIIYHIASLRRKAYASEMRRSEVVDRRIRSAINELLPKGQLQERIFNFATFYNRHGAYFIDWLYNAADVDQREHTLVYL